MEDCDNDGGEWCIIGHDVRDCDLGYCGSAARFTSSDFGVPQSEAECTDPNLWYSPVDACLTADMQICNIDDLDTTCSLGETFFDDRVNCVGVGIACSRDDNDSYTEAETIVEADFDRRLTRTIDCEGDFDWYYADLTREAGTVALIVWVSDDVVDTWIDVYESDGRTYVGSDDDAVENEILTACYEVAGGSAYYFAAHAHNSHVSDTGNVAITVSTRADCYDLFEREAAVEYIAAPE